MKSILIIDTPKNCPDCQLMADGWCYGIPSREEVQGKIKYLKRPSWCPLKELPSNKEIKGDWENVVDVWIDGAKYGYNKCLNDISGETE